MNGVLKILEFPWSKYKMIGLRRFLSPNSLFKRTSQLNKKSGVRHVYKLDFDSKEEIVENYFDNIALIGINLPDNKNILTESAVQKLRDSIVNFDNNDKFLSAVLCGFGGNFCTGIESTESALKEGQKLIETLQTVKKPIIAALNGSVVNFGFQLAVMCDLRIMEDESFAGLGSLNERAYIPDIVYQRLAATIGISLATDLTLARGTNTAAYYSQAGFCSTTSCGTALGQAVRKALTINQKPLDEIIREKEKILSILPKSC